jgi:hypothetical protein
LLELLLEFLLEVALQLAFEVCVSLGWTALTKSMSDEHRAHRILGPLGHFLIGIIAGGVSLLVYSHRVVRFSFVPGASLLLAPLATGTIMEGIGRLLLDRGYVRLALFTFKGGFWFAFGMALLRFAYVESL